ncbi:MAG: hypothetical protein JAZ05_11605, partial [Candidatus Thiodiazotropha taylori]|nr:hypothetical protein [Candidatus Thiodiazotropha taylori]MCW4292663.1 hypothetical protein [Candidatus Thiodiazotropha taylori]
MNIEELIAKGGPVIWILLAYSSIGLAIVLERYLLFVRLSRISKAWLSNLGKLLELKDRQQQIVGLKGPEARIIQAMVQADSEGVKDL